MSPHLHSTLQGRFYHPDFAFGETEAHSELLPNLSRVTHEEVVEPQCSPALCAVKAHSALHCLSCPLPFTHSLIIMDKLAGEQRAGTAELC